MRLVICIQYFFCTIENIITFPVYKHFLPVFIGYENHILQASNIAQWKNSTSAITRKICMEFRVLSYTTTFWSMFNTCLHSIFKVKIFWTKVVFNKKNCLLNMTTANDYVPKKYILISQKNVKLREWKTSDPQLVNSSICLSLSARLFIFRGSFLRKSCH